MQYYSCQTKVFIISFICNSNLFRDHLNNLNIDTLPRNVSANKIICYQQMMFHYFIKIKNKLFNNQNILNYVIAQFISAVNSE